MEEKRPIEITQDESLCVEGKNQKCSGLKQLTLKVYFLNGLIKILRARNKE